LSRPGPATALRSRTRPSDAGAEIAPDAASAYADADIVLKVRHPTPSAEESDELALMKRGAVLIGILNPYANRDRLPAYAEAGIIALAMDVLSSQANLAGYRAVVNAASELPLNGCALAAPCSSPILCGISCSSLQHGPAWTPP
jgi:NAD/NADP transhydrogenase alpha subunit